VSRRRAAETGTSEAGGESGSEDRLRIMISSNSNLTPHPAADRPAEEDGVRTRETWSAHPTDIKRTRKLGAHSESAARSGNRIVLFVTSTISYGGSEKHLLELIARLDDSVRPIILCAKTDPFTDRLSPDGDSRVTVISGKLLKSAWDWFSVFRSIKPDVAVFVYGTLFDLPWYATVAAWAAGIRKLYAIQHLIPPPMPPKVAVKTARDALRRVAGGQTRRIIGSRFPPYLCEKTICVSNAVRDSLVRDYRFPSERTITIHNGVSLSEFVPLAADGIPLRTKLGIRSEEFVVVCAARLSEEKGIDVLLLAISQLLRRDLTCKCLIVGDGYLREELIKQIRELGLTHDVLMVGFQEDVRPYLLASDVFVLTSHKEGLPFAVLEAMACGLPCVVTNVGGNAEAVAQNVTGLVVTDGSVDEVVQAMAYLLTHPRERLEMARAARARACKEFDIEASMAEIKRVILN
jgi:glycosyltransferase involved in cell wall biosynthesis